MPSQAWLVKARRVKASHVKAWLVKAWGRRARAAERVSPGIATNP
jgi:hypothetical protein